MADKKVVTEAKLGWMAGIIDLRGRFYTKDNKTRATKQVVLMLESKKFTIVEELCRLTGLSVEYKARGGVRVFERKPCSIHCPEKHIHVGGDVQEEHSLPDMMRWTITGAGLAVVLSNLLPYFVYSENDYESVMRDIFIETPISGRGSSMVQSSVRRLALLGWKLPLKYRAVME